MVSNIDNVIDIRELFDRKSTATSDDPFAGIVWSEYDFCDVKLCDGTVITEKKIRKAARELIRNYWRPSLGLGNQ